MKNLILFLLFFGVNLYAQSYKILDIEKYEKKSQKKSGYAEYKENDSIFMFWVNPDGSYVEKRVRENWIREKTYTYYKESPHTLAFEGEYFFGVPTGIHKKYSREGQLVEQTDYDAEIRSKGLVTRDDLAKIMKRKFGINIEKEDELLGVDTFEREGKLIWQIICKPQFEKGIKSYISFLFDAKSGVFLGKEKYILRG